MQTRVEAPQRADRITADRAAPPSQRAAVGALAARMTRAASKQAYYTVRALADRDRAEDAYQAYAYFRWVDDLLDQRESERSWRLAFVARQQSLMDRLYEGEHIDDLTIQEQFLSDLIQGDDEPTSGLRSYIRNMMAVMEFDAYRRGQLVGEHALEAYALHLAKAVTDALHYFIGHTNAPPLSASRYQAALGAHITHMLRDTFDDVALGYFNIPREVLDAGGVSPYELDSAPYHAWVRRRVERARACFAAGDEYLRETPSLRCRLAGYAYMARFTGVLDAIERDGYRLRPAYPDASGLTHGLRTAGAVGVHALLRG
ncbi:MAG TPA: squalene/phytoene synthase family protein [Ktedonobacterales bacterium]